MAFSGQPRVIFIGNIPFEITEEQLIDIFKEVGPVMSFRLMFDRETGRSRGYAFCEYADSETASSAIRNLTGYEIGGRHLKVDKADNDMLPSVVGGSILGSSGNMDRQQGGQSSASVPSARPVQNFPGVPASASTAAIHSILSAPPFTNPQSLLELLTSLKGTIQNNPDQARHLLAGNPALSYALLQAFVSVNLIDMSTVQSLLVQSQQAIQQQAQSQSPSHVPPSQTSAEQQKALIMQIMNMSPEQISLLPPQQRDQVLQLKQQILLQQQQMQK